MADKPVFSSGELRFCAVGGTPSASDRILALQDIAFNDAFNEALVRVAAQLSQFPIADAQYDHEISLDYNVASLPASVLPYTTGAVQSSAGGYDVYTIGKTATPDYHQAEFRGLTADKKTIIINFPRAKTYKTNLQFKRDGFVNTPLQTMYRPEDANFQPVTIKIQQ